ncbi:uncharacterized protein G2W53_042552 [Senna tora]|uniref:Uncharacterized protein n=1 Tax=Senna tora TaxID=362788 RepID=A0A834SHE2_9FABA|nr:uncharacterized protein G2W53_042552 [Senna tora]
MTLIEAEADLKAKNIELKHMEDAWGYYYEKS